MEIRRAAIKIINAAGLMSVCWHPGVTAAIKGPRTETVVDASGNLRVPVDYRTAFSFWTLGGGSRPRPGFEGDPCRLRVAGHDRRLSQRWTVPGWLRLVKEVFEATTGAMTTGNVSHAKILKGWFVRMK